jgi:hypothetical protein
MTNKEPPFSLIDKKLLHLNKSLGQIETNANNEVIYNLKDHIRLNRGDQVTLYKSFVNERGLNAQTISLQQDYDTEWKFLYSVPADPKRIMSQNDFLYQEYIPYHNYPTYKYNDIGANGQPLILMKLTSAVLNTTPSDDFIIQPVIGRRSIFCPKDNYSVSSLGSLISDQLQGIRLPKNEESDYIQANIKANGGFTYQFYDDSMSYHIDLIDFTKTQSQGTNYTTKAFTDFCNGEDPTDIYPYLKNYLETICINQQEVYLFADLNVYDKFIQKNTNGENLYFYSDLHDGSNNPIDYFFLPCQIPDADVPVADTIYGKPAFYAIGAKSCSINFDFNDSSRFYIDKLHQPCLYPNQTLSDGSTPLTNTTAPGENNLVGQSFSKFYVNSQQIIHGILPVDNTSAVQVLDFCGEISRSLSDKKEFSFNCCFFYGDGDTLYFVCKDQVVPFLFNDNYDPITSPSFGYFGNAQSISSLIPIIPEGTQIVMSFTRDQYLHLFTTSTYWRLNQTTNVWDVQNQLIQSSGHFTNFPNNFKYGYTSPAGDIYVFSDKYFFKWAENGVQTTGLISDLEIGFDVNKYFTASPDINYFNGNLLFNGTSFDVINNFTVITLANQHVDSFFTGLNRTSTIYDNFLVLPRVADYWTFDQFFSTSERALNAYETSIMYRLGFSFSQLGDIQAQIKQIQFPVLSSSITNNLKGITTRQQASLGLQLGASGLGYSDQFKNGAGVQTPYNFIDVVGVFINELEVNECFFENNGNSDTKLLAKPGQTFASDQITDFKAKVASGNFSITYTDSNGHNQIWNALPYYQKGDYTFELKSNASLQITELDGNYTPPAPPPLQVAGDNEPFPKNMTNPTVVFVATETSKNFTSISILTNSRPLDAQDLPDLLGENNFYLIYSNLVNNNYYSPNQGDKAGGIVGICSLQFAANDTLFNTEAIQFTVNQTTILDQIIVRLTNPDGTSPPNAIIDKNSAFIFIIETQVFPTS